MGAQILNYCNAAELVSVFARKCVSQTTRAKLPFFVEKLRFEDFKEWFKVYNPL
jgi:hypothetical protein